MAKKYDNETKKIDKNKFMININNCPNDLKIFSSYDNKDKLLQMTSSAPWSKLFERKFILKNNLYFQSCINSNDVFFTKAAILSAKRMSIIDKSLVYYRVNQTTNLQSQKDKNPLLFINANEKVYDFVKH